MWQTLTSKVGGAWNWFMGSPIAQFAAALIGLVTAWSVAVAVLKREGAREEALRNTIEAGKVREEMMKTKEEIADEIETRVAGADAAVARLPHLRSTSELRKSNPELAKIILGDPA